ncbi:MAG TPA: DUF2846 domain-containing protein [Candidatus Binatia bacterium]|jgi:hypothetical protein
MSKSVFAAACLGITLLATGCIPGTIGFPVAAVVPRASPEEDALAKAYQTNPSKAGIYIYRNEGRNVAYKAPVLLDNVWVGDTVSKTYIFRQVDAGTHVIASQTENEATLSLDVKAGNNYFVWQELKGGPFAFPRGSQLNLVDEATGKAGVAECDLVQSPD